MSTGFLIVLLAGVLLVVAPMALLLVVAWRRGGISRWAAACVAASLALSAAAVLAPGEWPNSYEEKIVLLLAVCGCAFALLLAAALVREVGTTVLRRAQADDTDESTKAKAMLRANRDA
jgi:hypothetical protein